ncbi:MAG: MFS transporter [Candidatus Cloacimonetes bacterium]|nr:MFS transporter [Candidatus Cloacimonadota bacterium]
MNERIKQVTSFLGLKRSMLAMLLMAIFVGLGEKMAERFLPIYLIALGGTPIIIGLLNGMDNLLSALYSYPGGWLADKLGYKKALFIFNLLAIFGYLIVVIFPSWYAVLIGAVFFLSWTAVSLPATMDLVASVLPSHKQTMGVSLHSLIRRIPMALGPVIGGYFIVTFGKVQGVRYAFVAAIFFALIALFIQQKFIEDKNAEKKDIQEDKKLLKFSANLKNLLVSDILVRFCEQIPYAFVVIWVMNNQGLSAVRFGVLTAIEMVTAMVIYIPVAYLAGKGRYKPYIAITFFNFTVFPLVLFFCRSYWAFVIAFIIRGLKEFGEPTRKSLILALAPEGAKARTFGAYYLIRDVFVSMAAFGGAWLWKASPQINFFTASAFGLIGTLYFIARVKTK